MIGDVSFIVTYDAKDPNNGWRASFCRVGRPVEHLPTAFATKRAAIKALQIEQRKIAQ
jgi:hypothetical protein